MKKTGTVKYYNYDINKYPFAEIVRTLYKTNELTLLHELLDESKTEEYSKELFENENDDRTPLHRSFYNKINSGWTEFIATYENFIRNEVMAVFNVNSIIYQALPSYRIQLPNNIAVGGNLTDRGDRYGWHKDTDENYNHPPFEFNFIVPLTEARDTASVYIETNPGSDKFTPAKMNVGEFFSFMGGSCIHGNKPNRTGKTRVSFDFRVVLEKDYNEYKPKMSKLSGKKFTIGSYYRRMSK